MATLINTPQTTTSGTDLFGAASKGGGGGGGGVAAGVISGLADIATGFINASRVKNTYKFNQGMADLQANFNAAMAGLQGRMVRLSADTAIKQIRQKAQGLFSEQRAAYAKAGVKMAGSPAEVMMDSLREAELDVIYTDINATYNIGLLQTQGDIYKTEAAAKGDISKMAQKSAGYDALQGTFKSILNMGVKQYTRG